MSTDDDLVRGALSRSPLSDPGPCPDENALVAWASRRLDAPAAEAVEGHLAACDACRDVVGDLRLALDDDVRTATPDAAGVGRKGPNVPGAAGAGPARGGRILSGPGSRWVAIAAAVLLLAGAGVFLANRDGPSSVAGLGDAYRVVAVAAGPGFAAGAPLGGADLDRGQPVDTPRGGLAVLRPRGVVFGQQPILAWTAVPGASSYVVTVRDAEGHVLWRADAEARLTIPSDPAAIGGAPGEARVVEVAAEGALGRTVARGTFTFATAEEVAALSRARAAATTVEPGHRSVALAHLAARAGWWEQALEMAETAPGSRTRGTAAHAIATFVRKSLGLPLEGQVPHGER